MEKSLNKKILYIEDDLLIAQMYGDFLAGHGFDVTLEPNGDNGLVLARDQDYDVILLDIMLPGRSGTDFLKALKDRDNLIPNSKLIIMTNYQQPTELEKELRAKSDAYFIKTELMPAQLLATINQLFDEE